jgi:dihydroxy-acid dehydratase
MITIDSENNQIFVDITDDEIKNRIKNWSKPDLKIKKGILYKYVKSVSNASSGCVTDE